MSDFDAMHTPPWPAACAHTSPRQTPTNRSSVMFAFMSCYTAAHKERDIDRAAGEKTEKQLRAL